MSAHQPTVADAMLASPALSGSADTAYDLRRLLLGEHRHVALVVDQRRVLLSVVSRHDLLDAADETPARTLGGLQDRVVSPDADLAATHTSMLAAGRRRLAVVDDRGRLVGLLCLKRHGRGFCTAETVAERRDG